ncbi:MAG: L,D-transpeptidase family protein [Desulfobulbaceae bacterium]|nr:L,D-transpeptidase family protein [Desulfobulbaceae bacterium]
MYKQPTPFSANALFLALLLLVPSLALAQIDPVSPLQQRLEHIYIDEPQQLGTEPLFTMGPLLDLYRKNDFQPLWSERGKIVSLHKAVMAAAEEGLDPADYHLDSITAALAETDETIGTEQPLDRDILFSDALILLGEHILHGKVDRRDVEEKEGLAAGPSTEVDVDYYLGLIRSGNVEQAMRERAPQHPSYQLLKQGLARYSKRAEQGEMPTVPVGFSLKPGMSGQRVEALKKRLVVSGDLAPELAAGKLYDGALTSAVQSFQSRHGLEMDGVAGKNTIAAMNVPIGDRIEQIRANLERTRWTLHDMPASAVLVDIADFQLHYRHNGETLWSSRVMVGEPFNQTPVFRSAITYLVLNPTWTIPPGMLKNEIIPKILKDPGYLNRENLKVYDLQDNPVNPNTIDWSRYLTRGFPYVLRQDAGPDNALGRIKFMFPNPFHVYLHDTPSKSLFGRNSRALSHGCIRVQSPLDLGRMILANDPGNSVTDKRFDLILESGKTTGISLKNPLPVFLLYTTAKGDADGGVSFSPDVYGRDAAVIEALNLPPRPLLQKALIPDPATEPVEEISAEVPEQPVSQPQSDQTRSDTPAP